MTNHETEPVCKFEQGCHRVVSCDPGCAAAAAVSVPPPAPRADNRAAALAEAIAAIEAERDATDVNVAVYPRYDGKERMALGSAIRVLRRLADEAAAPGPCVAGEQPYPHTMLGAAELEEKPDLNVPRLTGDALNAGEQQNETPEAETVHGCPPDGSGLTPCCGRTPFELPLGDRISSEPTAVTCAPAVVAQPGEETDTGARVVAHVLATHTDLHCLNCAPTPLGDVWTPVTADELDDGGVCAQCGVDVLAGPRR